MDDQALPADTRLVIAQKSHSAAARSNKARAKTTNTKSAATSSQKQAAVELNSLFRLARNASLTEEERRKAAARMARVLLPATPTGDPSWSRAVADEYGFVISPKIASEYRDAKMLLQKFEDSNGSIRPGSARQADKIRARLAAIRRRSLEPPPHSKYGMYRRHRFDQPVGLDQFQQDLRRLFELEHKRQSKIGLTEEEVAEEAHRIAITRGRVHYDQAAKATTRTIPIVFGVGSDPVAAGLVASLNHPGGNLTGVSVQQTAAAAQRLELLHQLKPAESSIALLVNPTNPSFAAEAQLRWHD